MLSDKDIQDVLNGEAYVECLGNLYFYAGNEDEYRIFQSMNDDSSILCMDIHLKNDNSFTAWRR